jgi:hypothetical protein
MIIILGFRGASALHPAAVRATTATKSAKKSFAFIESETPEPALKLFAHPGNGLHDILSRPYKTHEPENKHKDASYKPDRLAQDRNGIEHRQCYAYDYQTQILSYVIAGILLLVVHVDNEGDDPSYSEKV